MEPAQFWYNKDKIISFILPSRNEDKVNEIVEKLENYFPGSQIIISNDRYSLGKGWALRQGLFQAKGDYICFLDADMEIDPVMVSRLIVFMDEYDVVVGKKPLSGPLSRKIITLCSRIFIGLLFGLWIDTQTGIKIFKRSFLRMWFDNSFAFDIEVLSDAKKLGAKIIEVPVKVDMKKKMPIRSIIRFIKGALAIKFKI